MRTAARPRVGDHFTRCAASVAATYAAVLAAARALILTLKSDREGSSGGGP